MEGSVLRFPKAELKVSDTGSAHWASSLILFKIFGGFDFHFHAVLTGANLTGDVLTRGRFDWKANSLPSKEDLLDLLNYIYFVYKFWSTWTYILYIQKALRHS